MHVLNYIILGKLGMLVNIYVIDANTVLNHSFLHGR